MNKLFVICGSTATGKTSLAIELARKFNGELVSADSRQVYKWMDIGTGKDLPVNSKLITKNLPAQVGLKLGGYYLVNGVRVWGYDLVEPTQEFSVGRYTKIAKDIIDDIHKRGKLPILVGGTGLYIKGVVDGIETAHIPQNKKLRVTLEDKSVSKLFDILARIDPTKAASLNLSDKKNSRRLVRAIEVADYSLKNTGGASVKQVEADMLFIGLKMPKKLIDKRIKERVHKRVKLGIEDEIRRLFKRGVTWEHQSMEALGYKQWKKYFSTVSLSEQEIAITPQNSKSAGQAETQKVEETRRKSVKSKKKSEQPVVERDVESSKITDRWIISEIRYAKRQMTWFKKDKRINWFDVSSKNWKLNVEKEVDKWYKSN